MDGIGQSAPQPSDSSPAIGRLPIQRRLPCADGDAAWESRIAFLHIAKTAGTSLAQMIGRFFSSGELLTHFPGFRTDALGHFLRQDFIGRLWLLEEQSPGDYAAISGHIPFCPKGSTPYPLTYVSFLRNPIGRMVSGFAYGNRHVELSDERFLANLHRAVSLGESPGFDNSLTRVLSGRDALIPRLPEVSTWDLPPVLPSDADLAITHLVEFGFVGLTERFDDSCRVLSALLGRDYLPIEPLNVTERTMPVSEISEPTRRAIAYRHREDIKVYLAGVERFNADAREAGLAEYAPPPFEPFAGKAISSGDLTRETCNDAAFGDDPGGFWLSCDAHQPIRGEYLGFDFGRDHHCRQVSVQLAGGDGEGTVRFFVEASNDEFRADLCRLQRIDVPADGQPHAFDLGDHGVSAPYWRLARIPDGTPRHLAIASLSFGPGPANPRDPDRIRERLEAALAALIP